MKLTTLKLGLAAVLVLASSTIALAQNAVVTRDSDVYRTRNGNQVVNSVERGQEVTVTECRNNRCNITIPGRDGWIRQNRLAPIDDRGRPRPDEEFQFGIDLGGGSGISIGIGEGGISIGGGGPSGNSGPSSGPRACFYQHDNFAGASLCLRRGESIGNLTSVGWNDAISSIRLFGDAKARACSNNGFSGECRTYTGRNGSVQDFNDTITSVEVN